MKLTPCTSSVVIRLTQVSSHLLSFENKEIRTDASDSSDSETSAGERKPMENQKLQSVIPVVAPIERLVSGVYAVGFMVRFQFD